MRSNASKLWKMKSIASKLWLGMMLLVTVVLILLWLFQIVFLESFYTDMRIAEVKKASQILLQNYAGLSRTEQEESFAELAHNKNVTLELMDASGQVNVTAGAAGGGNQIPMNRNNVRIEAYQQALAGSEVSFPLTHPRFNSKFILVGLPVGGSAKIQGVLLITIPLAPVSETVTILKTQLFYITGILLVIAITLSFFLSRMLTKPIRQITQVSAEMAGGNLAARINLQNQDELGTLAATINHMGQELSKIEQLRKDLIANISHELRTPLSIIRGYAETIRDVSGDVPAKREKQLGIIIDETERLSKIVNDILNLSQMQAGFSAIEIKPFLVNKMLERTVRHFDVIAGEAQVEISLRNIEALMVNADEVRLEQVLYNLINNAFNHTAAGDKVLVNAVSHDNKLRIEVSDTGAGIPPEELQYIWERFYKADSTGSGLGLAIVKSILEAHGFAYGVDSQVGQGTTFWFEISI